MATAFELVPHASAQPSAATASAIISSGRDGSVASAAASSVQPSAASCAGACRSRASITATSTSSRCKQQRQLYRLRPLLRPCTRARSGGHMQQGLSVRRLVPGLDSIIIAQHSPLRGYSTHTHWCSALVRQRLGGVGGGAPAHAQRTPAANREKAMTARRRACGVGRAIDGVFCKGQSQASKQTNKQRRTEQRVRRGSCE